MRDKYPRIGALKSINKGLCDCCENKARATHRVDVQTSWFLGEDDVFLLCAEHKDLIESGDCNTIYSEAEKTKLVRQEGNNNGKTQRI